MDLTPPSLDRRLLVVFYIDYNKTIIRLKLKILSSISHFPRLLSSMIALYKVSVVVPGRRQ